MSRMFDENGNDITDIDNLDVQGIMTINDAATYPPYATAFNGIDETGQSGLVYLAGTRMIRMEMETLQTQANGALWYMIMMQAMEHLLIHFFTLGK